MKATIGGIEVQGTAEEIGTLLRSYLQKPDAQPTKPQQTVLKVSPKGEGLTCDQCGKTGFKSKRAVSIHKGQLRKSGNKDHTQKARREISSAAESSSVKVSTGVPTEVPTKVTTKATRKVRVTPEVTPAVNNPSDGFDNQVLARLYPRSTGQGMTSGEVAKLLGADFVDVSKAVSRLWHKDLAEFLGDGVSEWNYRWFRK